MDWDNMSEEEANEASRIQNAECLERSLQEEEAERRSQRSQEEMDAKWMATIQPTMEKLLAQESVSHEEWHDLFWAVKLTSDFACSSVWGVMVGASRLYGVLCRQIEQFLQRTLEDGLKLNSLSVSQAAEVTGNLFNKNGKVQKRGKLNLIGRLQLSTEKSKEEDYEGIMQLRILRVQEAIVKILKMRKKITNAALQRELVEILKNMFLPSKKLIKEQIEWLIENDLMKRDEDNLDFFIYMAT